MVLYLIGLGLGDENDINKRGLEVVKTCKRIVLESYTSILPGIEKERLEKLYGMDVEIAYREKVEEDIEEVIEEARTDNVAFLVIGDPFGATTHTDLYLRALKLGVQVEVVHNASIMNACGACGLQLYRFGETVSIVFFTETWRHGDSFYDKILRNNDGKQEGGLHTLCLLDIKVHEIDYDDMIRTGKPVYMPPTFMTASCAASQLLEIEERRKDGACSEDRPAIALSKVGAKDQVIVSGTLKRLAQPDVDDVLGAPLHSLIVCGELHDLEKEFFEHFDIDKLLDERTKE
jgi:diphthine synthase